MSPQIHLREDLIVERNGERERGTVTPDVCEVVATPTVETRSRTSGFTPALAR